MVMRAFFDESGLNPHEDKALIMGGFLGTVEEWERISDMWAECLHETPGIEYFKSDEANHLNGQFQRLSYPAADKKKKALAKIIGDSSLQGFCATVLYSWFQGRDPKATKGQVGTRPYDWGFLTATSGVLQYIRDVHPKEKVDFIFDERRELPPCISMFNDLKSMEDCPWTEIMRRAGTCTSGKDTEVAALQMADLLSGEFTLIGNKGNRPSDIWRLMASNHAVAHVPCEMPPPVPYLIAVQGMGKSIRDMTGDFLKRFYKENERSHSLLNDFDRIVENKAFFDAALKALLEMHEVDPEYKRFLERFKK